MAYTGKFVRLNISMPTPYDDSLSYLEYLERLHTKINELITLMNEYQNNYMTYTDEQINAFREELDARFINVYQTIDVKDSNLRTLIQDQYNLITGEYTALNTSGINTLNSRITTEINVLNSRITSEINAVKDYINSGFINVKVFDVVTGQPASIQEALNSLADQFKQNALTCTEFDALDLTCTAFDGLLITAFEFDFNGITL